MKDYVIIRGSIVFPPPIGTKKVGDTVRLEENEAKKLDPQGNCLQEKSKHDAQLRAAAAAKAELEKEGGGAPTPVMSSDELALIDSYRQAKAAKVQVTLVKVEQLEEDDKKIAALRARVETAESDAKQLQARMKELEAQLDAATKPQTSAPEKGEQKKGSK